MIDLCTIVFQDEIENLQTQARSIELYCNNIGIRSIYVVVNDSDDVAQKIDPAWWGQNQNLVRITPRSVYSTTWVDNGWVSQQVLKLTTSAVSNNNWCMILDAKSFFVRDVCLDYIMSDGRPRVGSLELYPVFRRSQEIAEQLFGIKLDRQLGPGGVPFIVKPSVVRAMISEVEDRTGENFTTWFQAQGMLTEFVLYSAYLTYKYSSFDTLYHSDFKLVNVNVCHSEVARFDQKLQDMIKPGTLSVSVHRNAWQQLSQQQQDQYLNFLHQRGIV
jgi:hypothetical protein